MRTWTIAGVCAIAAVLVLQLGGTAGHNIVGSGCRIPNTYLIVHHPPNARFPHFPSSEKSSILACYLACVQEPRCHSVNFWRNTNSCDFLPFSHFAPGKVLTKDVTQLAVSDDADHFSLYACPEEQFWQAQAISHANILFRRHEDMCYFAYVSEVDSFNVQAATCARYGATTAKIRSQEQADDFRQWMGLLFEHHLTWNYTLFAGGRAPNCGRGWFWHSDDTPATWYEPHQTTDQCWDAMVVNPNGYYAQWSTNPRGIICEHPCALPVVELIPTDEDP